MKLLSEPFSIQNTDQGWLVTWNDAVRHTTGTGAMLEGISFTVLLPRSGHLTISEVQTYALKRAAQLLQDAISHRQTP